MLGPVTGTGTAPVCRVVLRAHPAGKPTRTSKTLCGWLVSRFQGAVQGSGGPKGFGLSAELPGCARARRDLLGVGGVWWVLCWQQHAKMCCLALELRLREGPSAPVLVKHVALPCLVERQPVGKGAGHTCLSNICLTASGAALTLCPCSSSEAV